MNKVCELLGIKYPIIQGGMVWCSGWKLASAVSNSGGLGLIGAGSMHPEVLQEHIQKTKKATSKPFGVNVPLLYPQTDEIIEIIIEEKVPVVFTSAGNPSKYTQVLKNNRIKVGHVVSNTKFAKKSQDAGVDLVVAEGFEAGGHNGREETTTLVLTQMVADSVDIPVISAGGISSGRSMLAAMILGAEGVQIGSAFAISNESSAHGNYINKVIEATEGSTVLTLKEIAPVRFIRNLFYDQIIEKEKQGVSKEDLINLLGKGRAKMGIFEGNFDEGEMEIGQVSAMLNKKEPVEEIIQRIINEYTLAKDQINKF